MSFCCREAVDITSKTVQKKQDSCIYESCFVAVNHGYFPMMPYVAFTFRFNGKIYIAVVKYLYIYLHMNDVVRTVIFRSLNIGLEWV